MVYIKLRDGSNYVEIITDKIYEDDRTKDFTKQELGQMGYFTNKYPPQAKVVRKQKAYLLYFPSEDRYELEIKESE